MDRDDVQEVDLHKGLETTLKILGHRLKHGDVRVERAVRPRAAAGAGARVAAQPGVDEPARQRHRRRWTATARSSVRTCRVDDEVLGRGRRRRPRHARGECATASSSRSSPPRTSARAPASASTSPAASWSRATAASCGWTRGPAAPRFQVRLPSTRAALRRRCHGRRDARTSTRSRSSVPTSVPGCEDCLAIGGRWVHLRVCLTCGNVGCCDSSPNRHASGHARGRGAPHHAVRGARRDAGAGASSTRSPSTVRLTGAPWTTRRSAATSRRWWRRSTTLERRGGEHEGLTAAGARALRGPRRGARPLVGPAAPARRRAAARASTPTTRACATRAPSRATSSSRRAAQRRGAGGASRTSSTPARSRASRPRSRLADRRSTSRPSRRAALDGLDELELKARVAHLARALRRGAAGRLRGGGAPSSAGRREAGELSGWAAWPLPTWVELAGLDEPEAALDALARADAPRLRGVRGAAVHRARPAGARWRGWTRGRAAPTCTCGGWPPRAAARACPGAAGWSRCSAIPPRSCRCSTGCATTTRSTCAAPWPTTSATSPRTTPPWPARSPRAGRPRAASTSTAWCATGCARWCKRGDPAALALLGADPDAPLDVLDLRVEPAVAAVGGHVAIACVVRSAADAPVRAVVRLRRGLPARRRDPRAEGLQAGHGRPGAGRAAGAARAATGCAR